MKAILTILISFILIVSGSSQTRNVVVGTNDIIIQPTNFWSANASNGRTGLGLGSAATNLASAFQPSSLVLSNLASSNGASLTNISVANVVGALATNGSAISLTNFPLDILKTNGNAAGLTNITAANITGTVGLASNVSGTIAITNGGTGATNAALARTNLGLGWSSLTNTNTSGFNASLYGSNTNPVLVNSNGSVVSPTNFWQVAPIQTIVQNIAPIVNSTNNATNARNLYVYSLATNISGVTNTVILPTNTATFVGDNATVIHRGTTSSVTAIRVAGESTNRITISNYDDAVKFIHENGTWDFYHNISFTEPIKFIDGNIEFNKAVTRTNLGIPLAALTNTNNATFQEAIFTTNTAPTNSGNINTVNFNTAIAWMEVSIVTNNVTNSYRIPLFK